MREAKPCTSVGAQLIFAAAGTLIVVLFMAMGIYHAVFMHGVREDWTLMGSLARMAVQHEDARRERFVRANVDAMARKLGDIQARVIQLESLGERVRSLAGLPAPETTYPPGRGGVLVAGRSVKLEELSAVLEELVAITDRRSDLMAVVESSLFDQHIRKLMVPTQVPVHDTCCGLTVWLADRPPHGPVGIAYGAGFLGGCGYSYRGRRGWGGVVQEYHPAYGNMVEIDHGNRLLTRYAHASKTMVKAGDLVRRGQKIAEVGSTGRSTGPHLHFEVWMQGVPQDPEKFLFARGPASVPQARKEDAAGERVAHR